MSQCHIDDANGLVYDEQVVPATGSPQEWIHLIVPLLGYRREQAPLVPAVPRRSRNILSLRDLCVRVAAANIRNISFEALRSVPDVLARDIWLALSDHGLVTTHAWIIFRLAFPDEPWVLGSLNVTVNRPRGHLEDILSPINPPNIEWITVLNLDAASCSLQDAVRLTGLRNLVALQLGWIETSRGREGMNERLLRSWAENVECNRAFSHLRILGWRYKDFRLTRNAAYGLAKYPNLELLIISLQGRTSRSTRTYEVTEDDIHPWVHDRNAQRSLLSHHVPLQSLIEEIVIPHQISYDLTSSSPGSPILTLSFGHLESGFMHHIFRKQGGTSPLQSVEAASFKKRHGNQETSRHPGPAKGKAHRQIADTLMQFGLT